MKRTSLLGILIMAALPVSLQADLLKLKNGSGVQGTLISADSREIVFLGADGKSATYPIGNVSGIDFGPLATPKAAAAAPAAGVITIPSGTRITVRTIDSIDGKSARAGMRYRASIADPIAVGSQVAVPQHTNCTLEVVSIKSGDEMALRLREINLGGKSYSTSTSDATVEATGTSKGKSAAKRGVGLGALGAGVGAIAGGGKGAAIGAAIGGGVGAVSAVGAKGKQINVPTESRLLFSLQAPLPLN